MKNIIAIIDYGSGNIHSVKKALEFVAPNYKIIHTNNKDLLNEADKIIFPGQGAIGNCMQQLANNNLIKTITQCAKDKPFLGICLGLQMLFEKSEEDNCTGLGLIAGEVLRFKGNIKIPHMGWNTVTQTDNPLWFNIKDNSYFYSVHSYFVKPQDKDITIGSSNYPNNFTCAINNKNLFATQFHPEKSSDAGLQLLKNFTNIK